MARMKKEELVSLVNTEIAQALGSEFGSTSSELSDQRANALDYYLGEPFGNEIEGRSKVISRDVMDTIEWIMPSLMRVFCSNNKAVEFDPIGPEDEETARQETEIVNHVFYKENEGFVTLYTFFKDALLQKNGIVKTYWDSTPTTVREEYTGLNDIELAELLSDPDVEPVEHSEEEAEWGLSHDVVIMRTTSKGCVKIMPIPPEEFMISNDTTSINPQDARFTCHRTLKTRSELLEMGFSKKIVNNLPTYQYTDTEEELARDYLDDYYTGEYSPHPSTQRVRVDECYMNVDFDGDGIAELRQVTVAGDKILVNEEIDCIPFRSITPIILSHKFFGFSVADLVMDLQLIKSTLLRSILDNSYQANNSRMAAQEGMVNLDDLLTSRPGGVVRTAAPPSQVLTPLPASPLPRETFDTYQLLENTRKNRTGVGQETMGLDSNVLAHGKTGVVDQSFDVARMRVELIARVFAETGVKGIFLDIHRLLLQNQDKAKWMKLMNKWVNVNPSEWKERNNMTINVGLGTGNKDRIAMNIIQVMEMQKEAAANGMPVGPQHFFRSAEKFIEAVGLGDASTFFPTPEEIMQNPPKPQPNPEMEAIKMQQQIETEKLKQNGQIEVMKIRQKEKQALEDRQLKEREIELEDLRARTEMELKYSQNVPGAVI